MGNFTISEACRKSAKDLISRPVWADLNPKCCRKTRPCLQAPDLIENQCFLGRWGLISRRGCWTGFLSRLAKGWVSSIAGTRERNGTRNWEGGQNCSFFQQWGLWCYRDCQPASMADCNHRQRSWSPDPKNSPQTIGRHLPLPERQAQVREKSSFHAFSHDFSKFLAKSFETSKWVNEYLEELTCQLCYQ